MANPEILIFDDDPDIGVLLLDALEYEGYRAQVYKNGARALALIKEIQPRLVVLDIMMPGMDGLSLCKMLRDDPVCKNIRIIIASGKSSGPLEKQALSMGADTFFRKPFNIDLFVEKVRSLIGAPSTIAPEPAGDPIYVTVLGCRSAGRTSCVALQTGEMLIVLDAGSGIAHLGPLLEGRKELRVILTHYHPDHVEGLSYLKDKDLKISICGPQDVGISIRDVVIKYFYGQTPPKGQISLYTIDEGTFDLAAGVRLSAMYLNHPDTTLGLRLDVFGKKIVYCPDNEARSPQQGQAHDIEDKLRAFVRDADIFIHDARYTPEDYQAHLKEGHSAYPAVVNIAIDAGAKQLMLFHFDPAYGEEQVKELEKAACAQAGGQITSIKILAAREGLHFQV